MATTTTKTQTPTTTKTPQTKVVAPKIKEYNPAEFLIEIENDVTGQKEKYLEVKYRVDWFRKTYPFGRLVKSIVSIDDNAVIVLAEVYIPTENGEIMVANASSQKTWEEAKKAGTNALEWAETAALGRALALAGFGTVMAGAEICEPTPCENGVAVKQTEEPKSETMSDEEFTAFQKTTVPAGMGKASNKFVVEAFTAGELEWIATTFNSSRNAEKRKFKEDVIRFLKTVEKKAAEKATKN